MLPVAPVGTRPYDQRMRTAVISDLHLGGDTGFQICTARGRRRLREIDGPAVDARFDRPQGES